MSTPPARPDNPDATLEFGSVPGEAKPNPDQTLDLTHQDPPPAQGPPGVQGRSAPDDGGGTLIYSSTDGPPVGQQTLDVSGPPGSDTPPDPTLQKTGMWSSVPGDEADGDFSFSSEGPATYVSVGGDQGIAGGTPSKAPGSTPRASKAGEVEPLAEIPGVAGYEILGELGRGAMGVVYKARQVGLKRLVALKMILSGGHASRTEVLRFKTEAEAVARLQHPNIVQVFEIGEHRGLPFFSLEFVDGGCLSDRLVDQALPVRAAADMVRKLSLAMACAHEAGIVHRDLKPANVLMTKEGEPKITDFGLAKKLEEDSGATRAGSIMGTPSYMAPEQAEGRPDLVGPHSDVYALGAILYDLLTGRPPFRGTTVLETLTQVRLIDPVPPARLLPQLPRDLETICLKCLNKEAHRRYPSARALAEDLRRFLAGEPIQARPVSTPERLWKWSKRNPAKAGLAAVSALSVVMMGVGALAYAGVESKRRAEAEHSQELEAELRKRAEGRAKDARDAVDQMLTRIAEEKLENQPHMEHVRRDLLEKAAAFYQRFLQEEESTPQLRHEAALAVSKYGDILRQLGRVADAEASLRRALAMIEAVVEEQPGEAKYREDLAAVSINLANLLREGRRLADAEQAYARAVELNQKLVQEAPADVGRRRELSRAHYNRALLEEAQQKPAAAALSLRSAREVQEKLAEELPGDRGLKQELARAWTALGRVRADKPDEAEKAMRQGLTILEGVEKEAPKDRATREELLLASNQLADLLSGNRPRESGPLFARAVGLGRELVRDYPAVPDYQRQLAASLNGLALWHLAAGRRAQADAAFAEALRLKGRLAAGYPERPDYRLDLAKSQGNVGLAQQTAGRVAPARDSYRRAVTTLRELTQDFPGVADYERQLALGLEKLASADANAADVELREALEILGRLVERDPRSHDLRAERARVEFTLGTLLQAQQRFADAEGHLRRAVAELRDLVKRYPEDADDRRSLGTAIINLADLCRRTKREKEAESLGSEAAALFGELAREKPGRPEYPREQARALHNLGTLHTATKRLGDAEKCHKEALAVRKGLAERYKGEPALRQELASSHAELGIVLAYRNNMEAAKASFREAIALLEKLNAEEPAVLSYISDLATQQDNLAGLLYALGTDDAAAYRHWRQAVGLLARGVALVRADGALDEKQRAEAASAYAQRAVDVLRKAAASGYRDAEALREAKDLAPLAGRADFKSLLAEMAKKPAPGGK